MTRLNVASNNGASICMSQNLTEFKGETDKSKIIVGPVNILLSESTRIWTDRISKRMEDLSIINQCDLTDIYRTLYPQQKTIQFFQVCWTIRQDKP